VSAPVASSRVLPTLNIDGSRRWVRPKPAYGAFWVRRRAVAYVLMFVFLAIPYIKVGGKPFVLLDLPRRRFTFVGVTFLPTDTLLLMLLMASILIGIFLLSALFGRVWCGWACPQTVYMEFLFRPIERFFEGGRSGSLELDRGKHHGQLKIRRIAKYAVYGLLSLILAHTFLAYFVGVEQLAVWVRRSPVQHPTSFGIMALTTAAIMLDFTWFREQTCLVACPYGRWQSALLDRQSLVVAYDFNRGEPRAKGRAQQSGTGDCIDCGACVQTCPTGIDIRDGLQMECIHCTQCADACDDIMLKVGRPTGLVRYTSREALETKNNAGHKLRVRTVLYPVALCATFGGFLFALLTRVPADITVLRGLGVPYAVEADGRVANQLRIKITNRSAGAQRYTIAIDSIDGGVMIAPWNPLPVAPGETEMADVFVMLPGTAFARGEHRVAIRITDGGVVHEQVAYRLVGPAGADGRLDSSNRGAKHP
jgi:cytochrome c oxidase accessory protein FixG